MNKLSTVTAPQVPDNINNLRFVLIGREKLISVKAEIRAIEKLELATGVREQKKEEAQLLAGALLDAEARIGEILKRIPKQPGERTDLQPHSSGGTRFEKPKEQVMQDMGYAKTQAHRFETWPTTKR